VKDKYFDFKKSQIEQYLEAEFKKKFRKPGRISLRKRQKFLKDITRKASKRFGKDVLCLVDFNKGGFRSLISPARVESTDKGSLYQSFVHSQVFYTSHCLERFSLRTDTQENCILALDGYMTDALLTFGEHEGYLTCPVGVFAYVLENERLVVKTFLNFEMLTENQILDFYGPGTMAVISEEYLCDDFNESDFIVMEDSESHSGNAKSESP